MFPFSSEIFQYVPLRDSLSRLGEHLVPVLHLHRAALAAQDDLADLFIASHPVVVHHADADARRPDPLVRDVEVEGFVEDGVEGLLLDHRLLLL